MAADNPQADGNDAAETPSDARPLVVNQTTFVMSREQLWHWAESGQFPPEAGNCDLIPPSTN